MKPCAAGPDRDRTPEIRSSLTFGVPPEIGLPRRDQMALQRCSQGLRWVDCSLASVSVKSFDGESPRSKTEDGRDSVVLGLAETALAAERPRMPFPPGPDSHWSTRHMQVVERCRNLEIQKLGALLQRMRGPAAGTHWEPQRNADESLLPKIVRVQRLTIRINPHVAGSNILGYRLCRGDGGNGWPLR